MAEYVFILDIAHRRLDVSRGFLVLFSEKPANAIHSVVMNLRNVTSLTFILLPPHLSPRSGSQHVTNQVTNKLIATMAVIYNDIFLRLKAA